MTTIYSPDLTLPEVILKQTRCSAATHLRITILYHPDAQRIGEVADLQSLAQGDTFELSRTETRFGPPADTSVSSPLKDPYLSRSPIVIRREKDGIELSPPARGSSLQIGGQAVTASCRLSTSQLESGQVLVLARRLVLLLHLHQPQTGLLPDCDLIGESWQLQRVRSLVSAYAPMDSPVLLLGESGTGKELVARAIHRHSRRREGPWVAVNMAAIPADLASAELFGVRKGAFTGADQHKPGFFQQAQGGTLFLDEIGACPSSVQPLLLRALQNGEVQVAGGEIERVNVRVISATDAPIDAPVEGKGQVFSAALRHRLGALELKLPTLRERPEDIGRLLCHFFRKLHTLDSEPLMASSDEAAAQWAMLIPGLVAYRWPGNVRELENYCQQIVVATGGQKQLQVPENILQSLQRNSADIHDCHECQYRRAGDLEEEEILSVMERVDYEPAQAARLLRVSRSSLYRRLEHIPTLRRAGQIPRTEIVDVHKQCGGSLPDAARIHRVSRSALLPCWRALELMRIHD